ncbi:MBL fold metallo-hydrolase [Chelatococcus sambhunathii]|uniref:MBL fold metallo-hydrolase n=1 Tax=Chelatococcus sambhunathii TaxID=363953 RepID=A0ABU1DDA8_9HYPH|nr:MBL fold metallo-hydrolase [Chelatococcus sambhunathii]MDR4306091.1 MBL fold metallo-hydrolase [Chelatococcus sambhunathii]
MSDTLDLDRTIDAPAGAVVEVAPNVRRVVAPNPSPFTFTGTATYVVGRGRVAIVDPGPDHDGHRAVVLEALAGESVEAIVVTHTHMDHTAGVRAMAAATGAKVVGAAPHRSFRALHDGETNRLDASADTAYRPDLELRDGEGVSGPGWSLVAIATPGHTANHLCFAMPENRLLLSGDHVMAWSTTIVAPPDGAMGPYVASLKTLIAREEELYLPGHGPAVKNARAFTRHLLGHRLMRETAIRERLASGPRTIPEIVAELYRGVDPRLAGAAGLSVFAHLEELCARGLAATEGPPRLDGVFRAPG